MAKEYFTTREMKSKNGFVYHEFDNIKESSLLSDIHVGKRVMVAGFKVTKKFYLKRIHEPGAPGYPQKTYSLTMIYLTSDTYFGRFTSAKDRSIDPEKYNQELIDKWNSIVKPTDIIWHLGGFSWDLLTAESVIPKLNGIINVIMAPTDECQKDVFHIHGIPTHKGYFELIGHNVVLSHYPMVN